MLGPLRRMLEAKSIAVVGASNRTGSFGMRLAIEALRSPSRPRVHLVHPKYDQVLGRPCVPSLAGIAEPVDLVLLGVPDNVILEQLAIAAGRGDGGVVIFGPVKGLGDEIRMIAADAGLAVCGGSCMGFVNVARGIRAIGYVERELRIPGPIALVTHSGSVFSALLRTHRRLEYSVAVSAGQELVTTAADYLEYALELDETQCVGLFLETVRDPSGFRAQLARAAERSIPVVAVAAGGSSGGRPFVTAHSGALAGANEAWDALFEAYGVHRAYDVDELVDTLELFAPGRRVEAGRGRRAGIATVHDSGGERALVADTAESLGVPFADLSQQTRSRLEPLIDPSLEIANPLDVWGTGHATEELFTQTMAILADDPSVSVVVLCVDLIEEYDGDDSYPRAIESVHASTTKPVVVLGTTASALDQRQAAILRAAGIPVLEGLRSGLRALSHFLATRQAELRPAPVINEARRARWSARLAGDPLDPVETAQMLADYGVTHVPVELVENRADAVAAAHRIGLPVALKTAMPGIDHKLDVGGVALDLADVDAVERVYSELAERLGPRVVVQAMAQSSVELALGLVNDPVSGPLVLLSAGGAWIEVLGQSAAALPPLTDIVAETMIDRVPLARAAIEGHRGRRVDRASIQRALMSLGQLAVELGDLITALDVNPLICSPDGAVAVDALVNRAGPTH